MITIYLKFNSKEEALLKLNSVINYAQIDIDGMLIYPTTGEFNNIRYDLDFVGEIRKETGEYIDDIPVSTTIPGYHVNVLWWGSIEDMPDFGANIISPNTPTRIFA
jgi:hypothetical protein